MSIPKWVSKANFYQIFPDRFHNGNPSLNPPQVVPWETNPTPDNFMGGDLPGITDKLDYLADLKINAIYLNPIFSAVTNHRYDAVNYFEIDSHLGDIEDFDKFIKKAHTLGIRVILDGVFNHCGNAHYAFKDVIENESESKYVNWFMVEKFPVISDPENFNYRTCTGCYYLPKWNIYNPEVRKHHLEVAKFWLNRGIDGWRLDVPYLVNMNFWYQFHEVVKGFGEDKYLVAEDWRDPTIWLKPGLMDGVMNYSLRNLVLAYTAEEFIDAFKFVNQMNELYARIPQAYRGAMFNLLGSHDTERVMTRCKNETSRTINAYALLYSMQGAPVLYYGDEVGMTGENDPGCRGGMNWNKTEWNQEIHESVGGLLSARSNSEALQDGIQELVALDAETVLVKRRFGNRGAVSIVHRGAGRDVSYNLIPLQQGKAIFGTPSVIGESYRVDSTHPLILEGKIDERKW